MKSEFFEADWLSTILVRQMCLTLALLACLNLCFVQEQGVVPRVATTRNRIFSLKKKQVFNNLRLSTYLIIQSIFFLYFSIVNKNCTL